jgi:hypothetical protein
VGGNLKSLLKQGLARTREAPKVTMGNRVKSMFSAVAPGYARIVRLLYFGCMPSALVRPALACPDANVGRVGAGQKGSVL